MKAFVLMIIGVCFPFATFAKEKSSDLQFDSLPYAFNALEPHIDAKTMEIHYTRHHRGYYDNLLKAMQDSSLKTKTLPQIF